MRLTGKVGDSPLYDARTARSFILSIDYKAPNLSPMQLVKETYLKIHWPLSLFLINVSFLSV